MKIRFNRKPLYLWVLLQWVIIGGCILLSKVMAASDAGISLSDYLRTKGLSPSFYALLVVMLGFDGLYLSGVKEYEVNGSGITFFRVLGKAKTVLWSEMVFIGPAYVGNGRFRHRSIFYSKELPRPCDETCKKYCLESKNAYAIQDSVEMRNALIHYCPIYTEKYEDVT